MQHGRILRVTPAGDWPSLPPDISPLYLALGCIVAAFLFFVLTVLIQRRRRRLQINQFASLHSEIDQLKYRILALEVTERLALPRAAWAAARWLHTHRRPGSIVSRTWLLR
jgi:hypothetical protein